MASYIVASSKILYSYYDEVQTPRLSCCPTAVSSDEVCLDQYLVKVDFGFNTALAHVFTSSSSGLVGYSPPFHPTAESRALQPSSRPQQSHLSSPLCHFSKLPPSSISSMASRSILSLGTNTGGHS